MTTKFTPGPWRVGDAAHTIFGPPNGNPSPETIARLVPTTGKARYANARLIAAAPEMYALLAKINSGEHINPCDIMLLLARIDGTP